MLIEQIYDLAMLTHKAFNKDQMEAFLERSNKRFSKSWGEWADFLKKSEKGRGGLRFAPFFVR
jgi:hypothetical protein